MKKVIFSTTIICLVFGMAFFSLASNNDKPDYNLVFENDNILSFHITVDHEDWLKMWDRPFPYVKCTVGKPKASVTEGNRFGDEVYEDVGLRFKGNSSSSVRGLKKSYKFKFDEFDKKQRFYGFKKLNFSNGFRDPSLLREKLAYDLFSEAGVPASRAAFAKLYLTIDGHYDDEYIGLYTLVEQVDKVFLDDRFSDTDGNLFKYEGMFGFVYKGDAKEAYEKEYEAKLSKKQRDYSVLIRFIKMLNDTPEERFPEEIEKAFNVENFLSWLAVNTLLSSLDSCAGSGHNYYLYYNKGTGKFEFIPWDLNEAFGNHHRMASAQDMVELDIHEPYAKPKILIERILRVPKFKERYIEKIKALLNGPFQQSAMYQKIDELYEKVEKYVRTDMWKDFTTEDFERSIEHHIQSKQGPSVIFSGLKPFVAERIKSVEAQLTGQRRGFVPRPFKPPFGGDFPPPPPHGGE